MIAGSRSVAALAVLMAAAIHVGGVMRLDLVKPVEMEGGQAGATEASLGNAFADLAQGTLTGIETTDVTEPVPVERAAETTEPTEQTTNQAPIENIRVAEPDTRVEQQDVDDTTPGVEPDQVTASASAIDAAPVPQPTLRVAPSVSETPPALQSAAPPDTLTAVDPDRLNLTQSLRPKVRTRAFEERNKPDDPPPAPRQTTQQTASRTPDPPAPRGNQARTNTRAGAADGTAVRAAPRATGNAGAAQAGNAAASNYPGEIMRKLQRARRPRVGDRGVATVSFRIASNGGLSAVSVARSSGSRDLDNAALQVIRGAAPFPAPPPGAQRSFSIQIKGR
ncbi:TonB family protein [uncultured Tateyamaria sp.]|uniref:energy transducer TonB family protein n=1 Tax=uncultured Tateyamaria sp. TaxID=455651 RepID=UPI002634788E|nr:TonB family protein [uncultured Tateyamaria sp.]